MKRFLALISFSIGLASYMYENELEKPDWFEEHFKEMHGNGMNN